MNANAAINIQKKNQDLPDNYGVKINFVTGKCLELELASHQVISCVKVQCSNGDFLDQANNSRFKLEVNPLPYLEYETKNNLKGLIPLSSIQNMEFDKRWAKVIEIKNKEFKKQLT